MVVLARLAARDIHRLLDGALSVDGARKREHAHVPRTRSAAALADPLTPVDAGGGSWRRLMGGGDWHGRRTTPEASILRRIVPVPAKPAHGDIPRLAGHNAPFAPTARPFVAHEVTVIVPKLHGPVLQSTIEEYVNENGLQAVVVGADVVGPKPSFVMPSSRSLAVDPVHSIWNT